MNNEQLRKIWGPLVDTCHMSVPEEGPEPFKAPPRYPGVAITASCTVPKKRKTPAQDRVNDEADHRCIEDMQRRLSKGMSL